MSSQDRHSYVEFYPSDWRGGTARMTPMLEWTYLQICLENWDKAEPVKKGQLPIFLGSNPTWKADLATLIEAGKVVKTGGGDVFVRRALSSAIKAKSLWERKSKGGKNAAKTREIAKTLGKGAASNENENENENESRDKSLPPIVPTGDMIFAPPEPQWTEFREHRVAIKKPMTAQAEKLMIRKLEAFAGKGHDPGKVLETSIENGWTGIFELKGERDERSRNSGQSGPRFGNGLVEAGLEAILGSDKRGDTER